MSYATATANALLYSKGAYNQIYATSAAAAIQLGYVSTNKSESIVQSTLTAADKTNYFSFQVQGTTPIPVSLTSKGDGIRIQLYDASGSKLLADSAGTGGTTTDNYTSLASAGGLTLKPGTYVAKVTYAPGTAKSDLAYGLEFSSGNSFSTQYKTTAYAETYTQAQQFGQAPTSYVNGSAGATLLSTEAAGTTNINIFDALA